LIVDRTVDLITPLLHGTLFREFVSQELEMIYDTTNRWVDEQLADVELTQVTDRLIHISKDLAASFVQSLTGTRKPTKSSSDDKQSNTWIEADLESRSGALKKHCENAEQLKQKMQSGYNVLTRFEQQLIGDSDWTEDANSTANVNIQSVTFEAAFKHIVKLNETGSGGLDTIDLLRFATINLMLNKKAKRNNLKEFIGN
jgi:hypothetical protein